MVLKSLERKAVYQVCRPLIVGDAQSLSIGKSRSSLKIRPVLNPAQAGFLFGTVDILHIPCENFSKIHPGSPSRVSGEISFLSVRKSVELAQSELADGVVHAPISKLAWNLAGVKFPGHTELISSLCGVKKFAMAIASGPIRTVMVTRHIPLSQVSRSLRKGEIVHAVLLAARWMRDIGIKRPRIGICALNPHAGESGLIGREEIRLIDPAVRAARRKFKDGAWLRGLGRPRCLAPEIFGPLSADSAFKDHKNGLLDCLLTMYHDQSLIPLKLYDSDRIVNVTLGLPFPRTSPGHGTAFDIAGKNVANPKPMIEAILTCARLAFHR